MATIALAAAHNPWLVFFGGSIGHLCCTALAIIGGVLLANKIPEKTVLLVGAITFLIFGLV